MNAEPVPVGVTRENDRRPPWPIEMAAVRMEASTRPRRDHRRHAAVGAYQHRCIVEVEGEIRGFVRKEFSPVRRPLSLAETGCQGAGQVTSLIQRVSGASVLEIEKLITELQGLRDFLRSEGERVQREIAGYVQLSDGAMKSTKVIADSVAQWKGAVDNARVDRP